jgi:hypothetical protein
MSVTENLVELENVVLSIIEDGAETLEDVISQVSAKYVIVDEEYVADLYWAYTESYNSKYYA